MPWNVGSVAGRNGQQRNGLSFPDFTPLSRSPVHCPSRLRSKLRLPPRDTCPEGVHAAPSPGRDFPWSHGTISPHCPLIQPSFLEAVVFQARI